jgi:hypothetical protein
VVLLFSCCYPSSELLSNAVLGKIIKDLGSFDAHIDKFAKSLVPARKLIRTYLEARTGDRERPDNAIRTIGIGPPD